MSSTTESFTISKIAELISRDLLLIMLSISPSFDLSNGVSVSEQGQQKVVNQDQQGEAVKGQYSWVENGKTYTVNYIADENGFQPIGDHLPTPPPVPESVVKTLEYLKEHPYKETA